MSRRTSSISLFVTKSKYSRNFAQILFMIKAVVCQCTVFRFVQRYVNQNCHITHVQYRWNGRWIWVIYIKWDTNFGGGFIYLNGKAISVNKIHTDIFGKWLSIVPVPVHLRYVYRYCLILVFKLYSSTLKKTKQKQFHIKRKIFPMYMDYWVRVFMCIWMCVCMRGNCGKKNRLTYKMGHINRSNWQ